MLLDSTELSNPIIHGGNPQATVTTQETTTALQSTASPQTQQTPSTYNVFSNIMMMALMFLALYYFFVRPQKKQQKQIETFQDSLKPGDNIITTAGLHGKVIDIEDKVVTVEFGTNKSVRIPINKNHIIALEQEVS